MASRFVCFAEDMIPAREDYLASVTETEESEESNSSLIDVITTGQLTSLSGSDKFRLFFAIKEKHWEEFLNTLFATVLLFTPWDNVRNDDDFSNTIRNVCADGFLLMYGKTYWGDEEDRLEHLEEVRVHNDDTCLYPLNYRAIHMGLVLLIKRCAVFKYDHRPGNWGLRITGFSECNFTDISEPVKYQHGPTDGSVEYMDMFD